MTLCPNGHKSHGDVVPMVRPGLEPGVYCNVCGWHREAPSEQDLLKEIRKIYNGLRDGSLEQKARKLKAIQHLEESLLWNNEYAKTWVESNIEYRGARPDEVRVGQTWQYRYAEATRWGLQTFTITAIEGDTAKWSNDDSMAISAMMACRDDVVFLAEATKSIADLSKELNIPMVRLKLELLDAFPGLGAGEENPKLDQPLKEEHVRFLLNNASIMRSSEAVSPTSDVTIVQLATQLNQKATDVLLKLLSYGFVGIHINSILSQDQVGMVTEAFKQNKSIGDLIRETFKKSLRSPDQELDERRAALDKSQIGVNFNKTGAAMDKKQVAKEVQKLLGENDLIFGGYVRDQIAGVDFNDLDVFLHTGRATEGPGRQPDWRLKSNFIERLQKVFGKENVKWGKNKRTYNGEELGPENVIMKQTVHIRQNDETVLSIDLVTNKTNDPFLALDADVNGLTMKADGTIQCAAGLDLEQVKLHIGARVYKVIDTDNVTYRTYKLQEKGYVAGARVGNKVRVSDIYQLPPGCRLTTELRRKFSIRHEFNVIAVSETQGVCIEVPPGTGHDDSGWWIRYEYIELADKKEKTEKKMSNNETGFVAMVKDDAGDAAYRVAARQMTRGIRAAALRLVRSRLEAKAGKVTKAVSNKINLQVSALEELLDSDLGEAMISAALGYGLTYIPMIKDNPKAKPLAKEFRVAGMAQAGNVLVEVVMGEFAPVIMNVLEGLPEPKKVRIAEDSKLKATPAPVVEQDEEEEEEEVSAPAPRKVGR